MAADGPVPGLPLPGFPNRPCEDAGIGNGNGQHTGERVETEKLEKDQRPEQLMDGADKSAEDSYWQKAVHQRQQEAADTPEGYTHEGKSYSPQQGSE